MILKEGPGEGPETESKIRGNGSENGWIVPEGKIKIDDEIVTNGAQLLLSEEFKYQIKNENED